LSQPVIGIPIEQRSYGRREAGCGINQSYCRAVAAAGGAPLLIPLDEQVAQRLLGLCDGLLLAGGGDIDPAVYGSDDGQLAHGIDPERDRIELLLSQQAVGTMPVFGICRGIQVLNVALGGSLIVDVPSVIGPAVRHATPKGISPATRMHQVTVGAGTLLADCLGLNGSAGNVPVNSSHHQAVERLGDGLEIVARAPDGVIEGIEGTGDAFCLGVQWHPERLADEDPQMAGLFRCFVEASAR